MPDSPQLHKGAVGSIAFATPCTTLCVRIGPRASPLASSEFAEGEEFGSNFSFVYTWAVDRAPWMTHVLVIADME